MREIRRATPEDLSTVQSIARRTIDVCYRPFLGDTVDDYLASGESDRELASHADQLYVLIVDAQILGFTIFFDDVIHLMMVDPAEQRQGVGSSLLGFAEHSLAQGAGSLRLETFEANEPAIGFYLRNGWRQVGVESDPNPAMSKVLFETDRGRAS